MEKYLTLYYFGQSAYNVLLAMRAGISDSVLLSVSGQAVLLY